MTGPSPEGRDRTVRRDHPLARLFGQVQADLRLRHAAAIRVGGRDRQRAEARAGRRTAGRSARARAA